MPRDATEFGPLVDALVGRAYRLVVAANSVKLIFGADTDPRGTHYIWIDPPWVFLGPEGLVTTDDGYPDEDPKPWFRLFDPIRQAALESWAVDDHGATVFRMGNGYAFALPRTSDVRDDDYWYAHWYASDRTAS